MKFRQLARDEINLNPAQSYPKKETILIQLKLFHLQISSIYLLTEPILKARNF